MGEASEGFTRFCIQPLSQKTASSLIKLKPFMASVKRLLCDLATAPTQN